MKPLKLPSLRTVAENLPLSTVKLDKILAEGRSRVASYLDIRYPDGQDVLFLLAGKPVKAGRLNDEGRLILTPTESLEKMRTHKQGTMSFFEISKLLMIVILGTFMFEPSHGRLKTRLINFQSLLTLFARKRFTGYLELRVDDTLNYLTFFEGQAREGYFAHPATPEEMAQPVKLMTRLVETAGENGEINLYESVGEEGLHEGPATEPAVPAPVEGLEEERAEFTAEILDLCLAAIYEDLFRILSNACLQCSPDGAGEPLLAAGLDQVTQKYPSLFAGVREREDGQSLMGGAINFERLLKAKSALPSAVRDQEFIRAMNELASLRLQAMRSVLTQPEFAQVLRALTEKLAMSRKAYQGNFTITKFLYEFSRLLDRFRVD